MVYGKVEAGRALWEESLRLYRAVGDLPRLANSLRSLASPIAEARLGHCERVARLHQEAADVLSQVGNEMELAVAHDNLGAPPTAPATCPSPWPTSAPPPTTSAATMNGATRP